ncbi:outer membrane beta-barrel protein [Enterovirga sp.]|uniref:outer membrane protein n=1 Tax=Enterovirga sp. TaxID=2026350 RepID=UPI002C8B666A|nr:outer membrane beta-barrel protein [Enterovirga sp.]HMO27871.1 outer membrane beta-barrel protein [Enterovirga sp.]
MKLLSTAAALGGVLLGTAAMAADLPVRSGPPAFLPQPPAFTWTGFYVGLQAGAAWDQISNNGNYNGYGYLLAPAAPVVASALLYGRNNGANNKSGFIGGGHVGGYYQMGAMVVGLEGDLEGTTVAAGSLRGSIRGTLGYAVDRVLFYATGGAAFGARPGVGYNGQWNYNWGGAGSSSRTGWTVGGGIKYAFQQNWSAGIEYRYSDYGTNNNTGPWGFNPGGNARLTENAVRATLSYHFFSAPAPTVARY